MAWKVLSNLKTDALHKIGEVLETIEGATEAEIKKLEQEGIIQNLEADAKQDEKQVEGQLAQDKHTVEGQGEEDVDLARGQVEGQLAANVQQDLADSEKLANDPGTPVENNHPAPGATA